MILLKWILVFISFVSPLIAGAQTHPFISEFTINNIENSAFLSWTTRAGQTCQGIVIERSTDSLNYTQIGIIGGICGSSEEPVDYQFIDSSPVLNRLNYYRLKLGHTGYSDVVSIQVIDTKNNPIFIQPNPAHNFTQIHFKKEQPGTYHLLLYTNSGHIIKAFETNEKVFNLSVQHLKRGVFFFQILYEDQPIGTPQKLLVW